MNKSFIHFRTNADIDPETGLFVRQKPGCIASERFYLADTGSILQADAAWAFSVAVYTLEFPLKYLHTYAYAPDESWTTYTGSLKTGTWQQKYLFRERCYFRLCLKRRGNEVTSLADLGQINRMVAFNSDIRCQGNQETFIPSIQRVTARVNELRDSEDLAFAVLTDSHATVNGTWPDTAMNLQAIHERVGFNAIIHLGDLTDGTVSRELTAHYVKTMIQDMRQSNVPLHIVLGNHDANYFAGNPDVMPLSEQVQLYQSDAALCKTEPALPYYYMDYSKQTLRCIFLSSYENEARPRYGFDLQQVQWLAKVLKETPEHWSLLVFSHDAPLAELDFWSDEIRHGKELMQVLEDYQQTQGTILAYIHGHTHADAVYQGRSFPIISIGCAKCEDMLEKKPLWSETAPRKLGTDSQDLWDVLIVKPQEKRLEFVRFGAGKDRTVQLDKGRMKMKKVITYGSFDLFHKGHYRLLQRAKKLGDYLIVGVTTEYFDESRGKLNIVDSLMDRIENVKNTGFADKIIIEDHVGQKIEDIQKYHIDTFVLGSDWTGKYDYLKEYCKVVYLERTKGVSSTMRRRESYELVRLGIIGSGRIAGRFVPESKFVSGLNIEGVYNPHLESAQRFAEKHELGFATDDEEGFFSHVNAVNVASPHATHYAYVKAALEHGKHVLCEKPLALEKKQAEELFAIAREKKLVLMEAIKTAYTPGFIRLLSMAKSGVIGEIVDVESCFTRLTPSHLRELTDVATGGSFTEFGSYTILPILKLLGTDYKSIRFESFFAENGVDVYTKAYFQYEHAMATGKTGLKVKSDGHLLISGTNGYIIVEAPWWKPKGFEICYEDFNQNEKVYTKFLGDGLRYELSDFVSAINGYRNEDFKLTHEDSIAIAGILEQFMATRKDKG